MHIQFIGTSPNEQYEECTMRKLLLIGAASALSLTAAAFALPSGKASKMDTDGDGAVSKVEAMSAADARFAKMDANSDGTLNAADREAKIKAHFQEMDADKNGAISEAEFITAHKDRMEDRAGKRTERGADGYRGGHRGGGRGGGLHSGRDGHAMGMIKGADVNNDFAVSKAEFRTAAEARFVKADTDNDGALSADEQKAGRMGKRGHRGDMPPPRHAA
jgi:EF hand